MSNHVPATTSIKRSRVGNIDTDRLNRRRAHVIELVTVRVAEIDQRIEMVQRAAELSAIEVELVRRGELARDGAHCLLVDRNNNPLI